ncbi:MAG: hypothetical protein OEY00_04795 [Gammaproteobacteria bacterium]|nr:hypothetical protein [Gammaproteobacteria bacterium]
MDFSLTRLENDEILTARSEAIRKGNDIEALEPFARAYLGLFYDIDSKTEPAARIDLLVNPELAKNIHAGFVAALQNQAIPDCEAIATAYTNNEHLELAYVVLVGMDMLEQNNKAGMQALPKATLQAAVCFHLTTSTFHHNNWYESLLLEQPGLVGDALLTMWRPLLHNKASLLPGLHEILKNEKYHKVLSHIIVPLLSVWVECRPQELSVLLQYALEKSDHEQFIAVAKDILDDSENLPIRNHVYWLASVFMIDPEAYGQTLINFTGQEKMKLLPLLDFTLAILTNKDRSLSLSPMAYAYLIRCLAVRFTPQEDSYGNLGEITMKVLWLFNQLANDKSEQAKEALQWLQKIRVLKLYKDVFVQMQKQQSTDAILELDAFVTSLREPGYLRMKKKWSDSR